MRSDSGQLPDGLRSAGGDGRFAKLRVGIDSQRRRRRRTGRTGYCKRKLEQQLTERRVRASTNSFCERGLIHPIDYRNQDWLPLLMQLTNGRGVELGHRSNWRRH